MTKGAASLVYGQLGGQSQTYVDNDGIKVTDGTNVRVHMGRISETTDEFGQPVGEFGLRVVSSDGTTVIIDGSSDMFRIAATGTITIAAGPSAGASVSTTVDVATGFTYPPAAMAYAEYAANSTIQLPHVLHDPSSGALLDIHRAGAAVVFTNQTRIQVDWSATTNRSGASMDYRWYILEQVGI